MLEVVRVVEGKLLVGEKHIPVLSGEVQFWHIEPDGADYKAHRWSFIGWLMSLNDRRDANHLKPAER